MRRREKKKGGKGGGSESTKVKMEGFKQIQTVYQYEARGM